MQGCLLEAGNTTAQCAARAGLRGTGGAAPSSAVFHCVFMTGHRCEIAVVVPVVVTLRE